MGKNPIFDREREKVKYGTPSNDKAVETVGNESWSEDEKNETTTS